MMDIIIYWCKIKFNDYGDVIYWVKLLEKENMNYWNIYLEELLIKYKWIHKWEVINSGNIDKFFYKFVGIINIKKIFRFMKNMISIKIIMNDSTIKI